MITVVILTKNSEETLSATLESVRAFSEVIVYDTGSNDRTIEIAKTFTNVTVVEGAFIGFGPTRNAAAKQAKGEWILAIDSDEVLSQELSQEILSTPLHPQNVYKLQRSNFFNGKEIRGCGGWYPDPVVRLYHSHTTKFSEDAVHEKLLFDRAQVIQLHAPLLHTPYRSIEDFLHKMQLYSTLFARQNQGRKQGSLLKALLHSWGAFFKSYFLKRGFLAGKEGFIISLYNTHTTFYKYLKLIPFSS